MIDCRPHSGNTEWEKENVRLIKQRMGFVSDMLSGSLNPLENYLLLINNTKTTNYIKYLSRLSRERSVINSYIKHTHMHTN